MLIVCLRSLILFAIVFLVIRLMGKRELSKVQPFELAIIIGILFAIAGFGCSIVASCSFFMLAYHLYDYLITLQVFRIIRKWIRPMIAGLLMKVMVMLCVQNVSVLYAMIR